MIAEDMALLRAGLAKLLQGEAIDVVGEVDTGSALVSAVAAFAPDVALVDIKLPPTWTDEGLRAATAIRARFPHTAVLLLSSYVDARFAASLLEAGTVGVGYLLKEHVAEPAVLFDGLRRVADGAVVIDPAVITQLLRRRRSPNPLDRLTPRQLEILELMAQGHANSGIGERLHVSERTVESHVRSIFTVLGIAEDVHSSRRVLAVLAYLRG